MIHKTCLALTFSLLLASSAFAGQQEEIDKAMKMYGDEARTIMNDAEDALKKGIPEVEDYFNNPGEIKKPQESFFGFGEKQTFSEPSVDPSKSCGNCKSQSVEFLGKSSKRKKASSQGVSSLTPVSSSKEVIVFSFSSKTDSFFCASSKIFSVLTTGVGDFTTGGMDTSMWGTGKTVCFGASHASIIH